MTQRRRQPQRRQPRGRQTSDIEIEFHFTKSNDYRTVHVDGAWGGVTPQGNISMGLFSERRDVPSAVRFRVAGQVLQELARQGQQNNIREMQVEVVLNLGVARAVASWLMEHVTAAENMLATTQQDAPANASDSAGTGS